MKTTKKIDEALIRGLFSTILEFTFKSGMSLTEIERLFLQCLRAQRSRRKRGASLPVGLDFSTAEAIKIWHNDPCYLGIDTKPKAIRFRGRGPSVEALAKRVSSKGCHEQLLSSIRSAHVLKRVAIDRFVPTDEYANLSGLHPMGVQHVAKSVIRLVETAMRNSRDGDRSSPLIERFARVPDLDAREAKAFVDFTRRQGLAYLQSVDDWLETRRIAAKAKKRGSRRSITGAGVHLFAYIGDEVDEELSPGFGVPVAGSSPRLSWAGPSGSRRAAAPCTTSGAHA
jgi:hypothetical protein